VIWQVTVVPGNPVVGQTRLESAVDEAAVAERTTPFEIVPRVAVMTSHPVSVVLVVYGNAALVAPVAMLTNGGTCNPALEDRRATAVVAGAGLETVTVQEPEVPGWIVVGEQVIEVSVGALPPTREIAAFALLLP
jgi:hypothetical protein